MKGKDGCTRLLGVMMVLVQGETRKAISAWQQGTSYIMDAPIQGVLPAVRKNHMRPFRLRFCRKSGHRAEASYTPICVKTKLIVLASQAVIQGNTRHTVLDSHIHCLL